MKHNGHSKNSFVCAFLGSDGTLIDVFMELAYEVCDTISSSSLISFMVLPWPGIGAEVASVLLLVYSESCQL